MSGVAPFVAFAQPDGAHLSEGTGRRRQPLSDEQRAGDEGGADGAQANQQDAELPPSGSDFDWAIHGRTLYHGGRRPAGGLPAAPSTGRPPDRGVKRRRAPRPMTSMAMLQEAEGSGRPPSLDDRAATEQPGVADRPQRPAPDRAAGGQGRGQRAGIGARDRRRRGEHDYPRREDPRRARRCEGRPAPDTAVRPGMVRCRRPSGAHRRHATARAGRTPCRARDRCCGWEGAVSSSRPRRAAGSAPCSRRGRSTLTTGRRVVPKQRCARRGSNRYARLLNVTGCSSPRARSRTRDTV